MLAVDFNHWKTVSSWSALAAAVDAVILKATQYTTYVDPTFAGSLGLARKTGKCVGVYHFVGRNGMQTAHLPPGDPLAEADWFLSKYAHQPGEMVIVDYEPDAEPVDPDAWLAAHCARIIARTGVVPVVYMNFSTAAKRSWAKTRALGCALWIARYYANNGQISGADPDAGPWGSFIGWQYTSNGSLPGISAQVDLSRFDLTPAQWRAFGSAATPAPPTPPALGAPDMRLARTPDGTIWLVTDTQAVATGDPAVYASLAKVWGAPIAVDQADITRINGASITPGTLAGDLRGDLKHKGEQLDALAAAVSKVSAPTLDPVAVAAGLAANQDFIDKLADALVKRPSA